MSQKVMRLSIWQSDNNGVCEGRNLRLESNVAKLKIGESPETGAAG
jgi:hypothetical protein